MRDTTVWAIVVVVLLVIGLGPYLELFHHVPWGPDAAKWVDRGTFDYANWYAWIFETKHFIGYRPVPALSFLLNWLTTGYEPWGYRLTDILLHLGVGVLLFDLHRLLTGDRGVFGLAALFVLCAHPATEEVLPFVARRSYLLAAFFGIAALTTTILGSRSPRPAPWFVGTAACMFLALFSNEGAFVLLPLLPLLVLHEKADDSVSQTLRSSALTSLWLLPTGVVALFALYRRVVVLGSLTGGYGKHYFAYVKNGHVLWRDMDAPVFSDIFAACWSYALAPHGVTGAAVVGAQTLVPLFALSLFLTVCVRPWWHVRDRSFRVPLLLALWMIGATVIVVASGTWFWRQAYFLVPPIGLAFAWTLQRSVADLRARRWIPPLLAAPFMVGLTVTMVATGPVFLGMNTSAHATRVEFGNHVHAIRQLTADKVGPGTVYLVLPGKAGAVHNVRIWANRFGVDRGIIVKVLARLNNSSKGHQGHIEFTDVRGRPQLVIDGEHIKWEGTRVDHTRLNGNKLYLDQLYSNKESRWVYTVDDAGRPMLLDVPPPPGRRPR